MRDDAATREIVRKIWNQAAPWWRNREGSYRNQILYPFLLRTIGDVRGKTVLDAGCGEGTFCRMLAGRGAVVTGVDFSDLVDSAMADETRSSLGIRYCRADIAAMPFVFDASVDLALCSLVLQGSPSIHPLLQELRRVLKPEGCLVISVLHPETVVPGSEWFSEWIASDVLCEEGKQGYSMRIEKNGPPVLYFHRTESAYREAYARAGFRVTLEQVLERLPANNHGSEARDRRVFWVALCK